MEETKEPITAELDDLLSRAAHKMQAGGFRRLPIVDNGKLVGIITERDLREYHRDRRKPASEIIDLANTMANGIVWPIRYRPLGAG